MKRLRQRMIVIGGVALLAVAGWKIGQVMGWIEPDRTCVPGRGEEHDVSGKVVRITHKDCVGQR